MSDSVLKKTFFQQIYGIHDILEPVGGFAAQSADVAAEPAVTPAPQQAAVVERPSADTPATPPARPSEPVSVSAPAVEKPAASAVLELPRTPDEKAACLAKVQEHIGNCMRCGLARGRKNIVFGRGNPSARLMFIGEGPGADEDEQGYPFVGAAGQLLDKMISAMGFGRDEVYIANIVKCRPPGNRAPFQDEAGACIGFLREQVRCVQPEAIICLGSTAVTYYLDVKEPISRVRGSFRTHGGIPVMPTFHPSYLLRDASKKREVWDDLKKVMHLLGIEPPASSR